MTDHNPRDRGTAHDEHTHKIIIFKRRMRTAVGVASWLVPFFIMAIGYAVFPSLRLPVSWPWNAPPDVFVGLFATFVLIVAWFLIELYYAANRETTVRQLQVDGFISILFALVLTAFGAMMISKEILPWWYLLPWLGTILDAFASNYFGVNNAAQKPLVQSEERR